MAVVIPIKLNRLVGSINQVTSLYDLYPSFQPGILLAPNTLDQLNRNANSPSYGFPHNTDNLQITPSDAFLPRNAYAVSNTPSVVFNDTNIENNYGVLLIDTTVAPIEPGVLRLKVDYFDVSGNGVIEYHDMPFYELWDNDSPQIQKNIVDYAEENFNFLQGEIDELNAEMLYLERMLERGISVSGSVVSSLATEGLVTYTPGQPAHNKVAFVADAKGVPIRKPQLFYKGLARKSIFDIQKSTGYQIVDVAPANGAYPGDTVTITVSDTPKPGDTIYITQYGIPVVSQISGNTFTFSIPRTIHAPQTIPLFIANNGLTVAPAVNYSLMGLPQVKQAKGGLGTAIAGPGDSFELFGKNFGTDPGTVKFAGGVEASVTNWYDNRIIGTVPVGAESGVGVISTSYGKTTTFGFNITGPRQNHTVSITPSVSAVLSSATLPLSAFLDGKPVSAHWSIVTDTLNIGPGDIDNGYIDNNGVYTAPTLANTPVRVTVVANIATAYGPLTADASIVVCPAANSLTISPSGGSLVELGFAVQFQATGSAQQINWYVNGVLGGDSLHGTISHTGIYFAPNFIPDNPTVVVSASTNDGSLVGYSAVKIVKTGTLGKYESFEKAVAPGTSCATSVYQSASVQVNQTVTLTSPAHAPGTVTYGTGGGGSVGCPAAGQLLETKELGFIRADLVEPGMHVRALDGTWRKVLSAKIGWGKLYDLKTRLKRRTETIRVNHMHHTLDGEGKQANVTRLKPGHELTARNGIAKVVSVEPAGEGYFVHLDVQGKEYLLGTTNQTVKTNLSKATTATVTEKDYSNVTWTFQCGDAQGTLSNGPKGDTTDQNFYATSTGTTGDVTIYASQDVTTWYSDGTSTTTTDVWQFYITVTPAPNTLTVSPSSATVQGGTPAGQVQFTASMNGSAVAGNTVSWSLSGPSGVNLGSIDANGLYTAPQSGSSNFNVYVTAQQGSTASSPATLTVTFPAAPPTTYSLQISGPTQVCQNVSAQYAAHIVGSDGSSVDVSGSAVWSVNNGAISKNGLFTAPGCGNPTACPIATNITATYQSYTATDAITVVDCTPAPPKPTAIYLNADSGDINENVNDALHVMFGSTDVTADCTFAGSGATYLTGNVFNCPTAGNYSIQAQYVNNGTTYTSNTVSIVVRQPAAPPTAYIVAVQVEIANQVWLGNTTPATAVVTYSDGSTTNGPVTWSVQSVGGNGTIDSSGNFTGTQHGYVNVVATATATANGGDTTVTGSAQVLVANQYQITIQPTNNTLAVPYTQLQFTAYYAMNGGSTLAVADAPTWFVNGVVGGSDEYGSIDDNGLYIAPLSLPANATVTISAEYTDPDGNSWTSNNATINLYVPASPTVTVTTESQINVFFGDGRHGYIPKGQSFTVYPGCYLVAQYLETFPYNQPGSTFAFPQLPYTNTASQNLTDSVFQYNGKANNSVVPRIYTTGVVSVDGINQWYNLPYNEIVNNNGTVTRFYSIVLGFVDPSDGKFHSMWDLNMQSLFEGQTAFKSVPEAALPKTMKVTPEYNKLELGPVVLQWGQTTNGIVELPHGYTSDYQIQLSSNCDLVDKQQNGFTLDLGSESEVSWFTIGS